ncbi:HNH endonuclease [Hymenobacter fodinae]|uniref:Restriction endonuclease n=1 Tax=Hymenobacter fodinae TaxID=2510796 RepID=A0A4Z0P3Y1_9BACT|nr:hypothetical protein [Hymenobacter fodinae]TGE06110.1 hypothetical protein EU556_14685 [Hymenobacter fodinae]
MPAVIVINDDSEFEDKPGISYEYRLKDAVELLQPRTHVVFYTGKRRSGINTPRVSPLTNAAHYFAFGVVDEVIPPQVPKGNYSCTFSEYSPFQRAVPVLKAPGEYFEPVPQLNDFTPGNARWSYWQKGVRAVSSPVIESILQHAGASFNPVLHDYEQSPNVAAEAFAFGLEGGRTRVITNRIERDRSLRERAIQIHGLTCIACTFNFEAFYGEYAAEYIHVHHLNPLAGFEDRRLVNLYTDLTVLCANCHCIVHRQRDRLLSIDELKSMIEHARNKS